MTEQPLWAPSPERVASANLTGFMAQVRARTSDQSIVDFDSLHDWSIREPETFWAEVWRFFGVWASQGGPDSPTETILLGRDRVAPPDPTLGPKWFLETRLNFAANLLRYDDDREAIIAWNETGAQRRLTYRELRREVARVAAALRAMGVDIGDRVGAFVPNIPETVIAMLATTSIGAIWSSCSPDFGANGVLDRFGQIAPRVLFCTDAYLYSGREIDCLERVAELAERIPSLEKIVVVPYINATPSISAVRGAVLWNDFVSHDGPAPALEFEQLPFDHPVYIMYSSGTTGLPKCMVHGAGGTLIQHLKELGLHTDLTRDDKVFYFTTCGWMMWNWLVSALTLGSTIVLYDGAALIRRRPILWDMAAEEKITCFGTSAKWLALAEKEGLAPIETHDLSALKSILSTGSPLAAHSFDYVYTSVKRDVRLSSISGGTDIISCFAGGNPTGPVWRGELQALALAMRVEIFDSRGKSVVEEQGELVCTAPFPSIPIAFWNDPDGAKYHTTYFDVYPNIWRHDD